MTSLVSIEHEITNILAVADELEDCQPQALEYLDSLALQEAEKVDAISHVVRRRKNQIEWLQDEERRLRLRRQAMERRIEAFREYLVRLLTHYGVKSIKGNYGSISLRDMQSVDVTDVNELPTIYKEVIVEQKPKKTLIKEALESGQAVDGARLVPRTIITIR
ncbi:MAG: hypothetical protein EOM37_14525 [Proteobacteria bacterium]|nr:hypothetical protein [Pseudomonadota bacterium]